MAGGWFDAGGGYEKFAYTSSYADGLMLLAARDFPGTYPGLAPEAGFGLSWLEKLWNPAAKVVYIQDGIGTGNASNTIQGDYNFWFLPQAEDHIDISKGGHPGPTAYYVKYRPVFEAAPPGARISPDFAGRFAADYALGAQLAAKQDPARAQHLLALARGVYAMAKTSHVGAIVTAYPHDFYPGTEWKSDMLWGAAEIALAQEALGGPRRPGTGRPGRGRALGEGVPGAGPQGRGRHAEPLRHRRGRGGRAAPGDAGGPGQPGHSTGHAARRPGRAAQARRAVGPQRPVRARHRPRLQRRHAARVRAVHHRRALPEATAGPAPTGLRRASSWPSPSAPTRGARRSSSGRAPRSRTACRARSRTWPGRCPAHGDIQLGATVDGPSSPDNFSGLGTVSGMRACNAGSYKLFNTKTAAYEDNVVSWPSVEPAADYTANSLLAFVLAAQDRSPGPALPRQRLRQAR